MDEFIMDIEERKKKKNYFKEGLRKVGSSFGEASRMIKEDRELHSKYKPKMKKLDINFR